MRLNRGSGLSGLSGIRASTPIPGSDTLLLRPLLAWRRDELEQIVAAAAVAPIRDPSNDDPRFDRVRMRSALRNAAWIDPAAFARSAAHLAEAEAFVGACVDREWVDNVRHENGAIHYQPTAPTLIRKRVAQRILAAQGGRADLSQIAEMVDRLEAGKGGNLAGVMVRPRSGVWVFEPEPPRRT
jgi:tRNA(Ile)-lysidine synthase